MDRMYVVLEQGHMTMYGTYEECCEYLDNVHLGWEKGIHDVSIIPYEDQKSKGGESINE